MERTNSSLSPVSVAAKSHLLGFVQPLRQLLSAVVNAFIGMSLGGSKDPAIRERFRNIVALVPYERNPNNSIPTDGNAGAKTLKIRSTEVDVRTADPTLEFNHPELGRRRLLKMFDVRPSLLVINRIRDEVLVAITSSCFRISPFDLVLYHTS